MLTFPIRKSDDPDPVILGNNLTYTIWVVNNGPATAHNVTVSESLPAGLNLVSSVASQGSWVDPTWTIGSIAPDDSVSLVITATTDINQCNEITNTVTVTSTTIDPDLTNNSATSVTQVLDETDPVITTCPVPRDIEGCSTADIAGPVFSDVWAGFKLC